MQDALLKVYRNWAKVAAAEHPDAYVRRIIVTTHLSWVRRLKVREVAVPELLDRPSGGSMDDPAVRISERDVLRRALTELAPRQRAVLVLRHLNGMDDANIADLLGCSESAVRGYASKGAARMRRALDPDNATDRDAHAQRPVTHGAH